MSTDTTLRIDGRVIVPPTVLAGQADLGTVRKVGAPRQRAFRLTQPTQLIDRHGRELAGPEGDVLIVSWYSDPLDGEALPGDLEIVTSEYFELWYERVPASPLEPAVPTTGAASDRDVIAALRLALAAAADDRAAVRAATLLVAQARAERRACDRADEPARRRHQAHAGSAVQAGRPLTGLLAARPAETATAGAGALVAIITALVAHDWTTAIAVAVVATVPAVVTYVVRRRHLDAGIPHAMEEAARAGAAALGYTQAPGETEAAFWQRVTYALAGKVVWRAAAMTVRRE
jgi:hypothetical protein